MFAMLIQYIIDEPAANTSNDRGSWILQLKEKQALKDGGKIPTAFGWDTTSQLKINFHRFAARNEAMDRDGLTIAFKAICDGLMESLSNHFGQKFDDEDEDRFYFIYSQCKALEPVFANTSLVTISLMPETSDRSGEIKRWGYVPEIADKQALIASLGDIRAAKIKAITDELQQSRRKGTKKAAKLEQSLKRTQKAIKHCFAAINH